jgi:hypothetical protein
MNQYSVKLKDILYCFSTLKAFLRSLNSTLIFGLAAAQHEMSKVKLTSKIELKVHARFPFQGVYDSKYNSLGSINFWASRYLAPDPSKIRQKR